MLDELSGFLALAGFGFLLGIRHALDADHIATLSNLISENKDVKKAAMLGVYWGIGHTLALLIVGVLVMSLKLTIPHTVEAILEFCIGSLLVFLGARGLYAVINEKLHNHSHAHKEENKKHSHLHYKDDHSHRKTLGIGILHGLAGSATLMILILATIQSVWQGIAYISIFGIGTILGMLIVSTLLGIPFAISERVDKLKKLGHALKITVCITSIVLGLIIMYENGSVFF